jgi:hypothetical protein
VIFDGKKAAGRQAEHGVEEPLQHRNGALAAKLADKQSSNVAGWRWEVVVVLVMVMPRLGHQHHFSRGLAGVQFSVARDKEGREPGRRHPQERRRCK